MGGESGEVVIFASLAPSGFGERGGFGVTFDKFLREFCGAFVLVSEFALIGAGEGGEAGLEFG